MSYARWSRGVSDVYVYLDVHGTLRCCGCCLKGPDDEVTTTAEMLVHLDRHRSAGHLVPESTIKRLKRDEAENDAWMASPRSPEEP